MPDFPLGRIDVVSWKESDEGNIHRMTLKIDGATIILCAGEARENNDGTLTIYDRDECVLVFLNEAAYAGMIFGEPVYRI